MLNQGEPVCDVLIVSPIESVWSQVCIRSFDALTPAAPEIAEMEDKYADLFHWLAGERIDFDYGDEEMMSRLSGVGRDAEDNPVFRVGQASYRTVLVGNMETMRRSTLDALEKFEKEGGRVIFMGEAPKYVDVQPSDEPALMASRCVQVDYEEAPVVEAVKQAIRPVVEVRSAAGENLPLVFGQVRRDDERAYVLMNIDRHRKYDSVSVTLPFEGEIALWDCKTGEVWKQPATVSDGKSVVLTSFEPCEEKVYTISASAPAFAQTVPVYSMREKTELPDSYSYTLNEPNICVLDLATWQIGDEPVQPLTEILKIDRAVRRHFDLPYRGGEMVQPWYAEKYKGKEYAEPLGVLKMNFPFSVSVVPSDSVFLCLETPQRFTILVKLRVGDIVSQGLPFYSGAVCYRIDGLPSPAEGERLKLTVDGFDGGCLELLNEGSHQICGWAPYELDLTQAARNGEPALLNVVLTRRNTFGPLHQVPALVGAYGPGNWTTEGDSFTMERYMLLPAGLTHRPSLLLERP